MKTIIDLVEYILLYTSFVLNPAIDDLPENVECLAQNIYFESRSEKELDDKLWVADVTLNRVEDSRYPNTICGVVKQTKYNQWYLETQNRKVPSLNRCAFSWYCDGKSDVPKNFESWRESIIIAQYMLLQDPKKITEQFSKGATHYHAEYVNPYWVYDDEIIYLSQKGTHLYYIWIR